MESVLTARAPNLTADQAYALCARLAKTHYENFTVGSWLLPRDKRRHVYAIYAFCRSVDDLGDEHPGDRLAALDVWEEDLLRCYDGSPRHPYLVALQQTIGEFDIPRDPFLKLVEANRMDQAISRHPTYGDLEYYCQHSANPVGHLVLYVFGYRDAERQRLSDFTCTALQLANFWQDVSRDYGMGRIYLPLEDMERFGYTEDELARGVFTDGFRDLMGLRGRASPRSVPPWPQARGDPGGPAEAGRSAIQQGRHEGLGHHRGPWIQRPAQKAGAVQGREGPPHAGHHVADQARSRPIGPSSYPTGVSLGD